MPNTPEAEHPTQDAAGRPRPRPRALDPGPRHSSNGAPAPDEIRDRYQQITERAGRRFLDALADLPEYKPRPGVELGRLRITVSVVGEPDLGSVDIDPVNLGDLAAIVARRAEGLREKHARASRPTLRAPARLPEGRLIHGRQGREGLTCGLRGRPDTVRRNATGGRRGWFL